MSTKVTIKVQTVGTNFGTEAVIRSAKTGRRLAASGVKPRGQDDVATQAAEAICKTKKWEVLP